MSIALVTLSPEGARILRRLAQTLPECEMFVHESAGQVDGAEPFAGVMDLTARLFGRYDGIVFVLSCGVAVRAMAPHLQSKKTDPAVVVLDVGARYAVSLLSGHEGGANDLASEVANTLGAEPVITTTSEARKSLIAGVGCRLGVGSDTITAAVREALGRAGAAADELRLLASAEIKAREPGLQEAARDLRVPLRLIPSAEIRTTAKNFERSQFVEKKVGLPAVAEPAALLAGRRTRLILRKSIIGPVTVALARENSTWLA